MEEYPEPRLEIVPTEDMEKREREEIEIIGEILRKLNKLIN